jgi:hypothetical protein
VHNGGSSVIHADDIQMKEYGDMERQKNIYIWRQVKGAICRTFESHPVLDLKKINPYSNRKELVFGDKVTYIDIRHCYLQIANKLGYINNRDYATILKNYKNTKLQVCAAITSLFREIKCDYYNKKGRIVRTIECNNYFLETAKDTIVNYSCSIMYDYCKAGNDYYYRRVDGIVVNQSDREKIIGYINDKGLKYKEITGIYYGNGMIYNELSGELESIQ